MKKTRSIVSLLVLVSFCFIAGGSFNGDDIAIVLILIPLFGIAYFLDNERNKNKAFKEELKRKQEEKKKKEENDKKLEILKSSFSNITKIVNYKHNKFIIIDEHEETIMIDEQTLKFKDIIDYTISDNSQIIHSATISNTSTDTGSLIGRSIVGGVVGGGVGAMIGGSTANRTTITQGSTSTTSHNYKICVTINSLSNPTITIELGDNEKHLREIESLLCIIVTRNKNTPIKQ